ncbi:alpha/beta hydrolase [Actinokineospora sp. PR83]|uniref:alpha/beta hydrolase n=1 Tax=Actinokineospora sp. PR83 TaxID=2884908 RepID=UPI0027E14D4C|nr:alpha/beta hydrolase [Actinokineospora sp. PR83]MCG8914965.1 alpha/beta hydrolase [Actinokineospora sp. PR83]
MEQIWSSVPVGHQTGSQSAPASLTRSGVFACPRSWKQARAAETPKLSRDPGSAACDSTGHCAVSTAPRRHSGPAEALGGSLLTVDGAQHGVSLVGENACVNDIVLGYPVDLKTPPEGARCVL